jgi:transposase-like protein
VPLWYNKIIGVFFMGTKKQYGKAFHEQVRFYRSEGRTQREIAELMNVGLAVIRKMVERQNRDDRHALDPPLKKKLGRPRVRPLTEKEEYERRIKELEMENEILKKFHEELRR